MKSLLLLLASAAAAAQSWVVQQSGSTASLRGISAWSTREAWASGTGGTYLHTTDGGATWSAATVAGAERLDFRDVQAVDSRTVFLMSIGPGEQSRIYKTTDAGATWKLRFTNPDAKGFFDSIAFWNPRHGVVAGDQVDGHVTVFTTDDGGEHWTRRTTPPAIPNEGAFAASGTCLIVTGKRDAWLVTGGTGAARVLHSADGAGSWSATSTPIRNDGPSAGAFSIAFADARRGIVVGGDYNKPQDAEGNIAVTSNGGRTWSKPSGAPPKGFRSAVAYLADRKIWIATGTSGSDISIDDGQNWKPFDTAAYNALSFVSSKAGWAVGPKGAIAFFRLP